MDKEIRSTGKLHHDVSQVVAEAARWEETRQRAAALAERAKAAVEKVAGAVGAAGDEVRKG